MNMNNYVWHSTKDCMFDVLENVMVAIDNAPTIETKA